ncbi:DUF1206 domain-containing protein [Bowdeniella nasicola]|uniref:DUF1206 domain-containing protein n=1 Tax=Bowdeniella nasicola TaxID=208480 RepID=UPI002481F913|nr:DUF1206 domain-containing protein [Bowdeniella nasicola]
MGHKAGESEVVHHGARLGHAANGLLHLLVAYLIVRLALGANSEDTDHTGALALLGDSAFGVIVLWVVIVGLVLLALWQGSVAISANKTTDRLPAAGRTVVHLVVAGVGLAIALGWGTSSDTEEEAASTALSLPGGVFIVGAVGLVIITIAGYHIYSGISARFLKHLDRHPPARS